MSVDVVGLRALAEAVAVEGPWAIWHDLDHQGFKTVGDAESYRQMLAHGEAEDCNPVAHVYTDPDAEFIAAANPSVVLALLAEITTLRAENERLSQMRERWSATINAPGFEAAVEAEVSAYHDAACLYRRRAETAETALADRDARITAARKELGGYILQETQDGGSGDPAVVRADDVLAGLHDTDGGSCWCGPRVVDVPSAVPVPQDNPEHDEEWVLGIGKRNERVYEAVREESGLITTNAWANALVWRTVEFVLDVRPKNGEKP